MTSLTLTYPTLSQTTPHRYTLSQATPYKLHNVRHTHISLITLGQVAFIFNVCHELLYLFVLTTECVVDIGSLSEEWALLGTQSYTLTTHSEWIEPLVCQN